MTLKLNPNSDPDPKTNPNSKTSLNPKINLTLNPTPKPLTLKPELWSWNI